MRFVGEFEIGASRMDVIQVNDALVQFLIKRALLKLNDHVIFIDRHDPVLLIKVNGSLFFS